MIHQERVCTSPTRYAFLFLLMSVELKLSLHVSNREARSNVMVRLPCHSFQRELRRSRGSQGSRGFGVLG